MIASANANDARVAARKRKERENALLQGLGGRRSGEELILIGTLADTGQPVRIPLSRLGSSMAWVTGASGSGKSSLLMCVTLQWLSTFDRLVFVGADAKGEFHSELTTRFLPATLGAWKDDERERFFANYRVINPFDSQNLPPMNLLVPAEGVPQALQAREVATVVADALGGAGVAQFRSRMTAILGFVLRFCLHLRNASLLEAKSLMVNENYLNGLLRFCDNRELRDYFTYRYPRENKESVLAVVSRLDQLLELDDTKRSLCAKSCVDAHELLERGFTLLNVGSPPRGAEFLIKFWYAVYLRSLSRAIMSREVGGSALPAFCLLDEWQTGISIDIAEIYSKLLTQARYRKVGLWLANQLPAQLGKFNELLPALKNSGGIQMAFRQSHEDARALSHILPTHKELRVPASPGAPAYDTRPARETEIREHLLREFSRLPQRAYWLYPRQFGMEAVLLKAPTVEFDAARRAADATPHWLREACEGRVGGLSRADLDLVLERRFAHIDAVIAGTATSPMPTFDGSTTSVCLPCPSMVPDVSKDVSLPPDSTGDSDQPADSISLPFLG